MRRSPFFDTVVRGLHRGYAASRHRAIRTLMNEPAAEGSIDMFVDHRTCVVATYKADGTAVATPVWYGLRDGRLYFRAERGSGKAKRLRTSGTILVAPCSVRGKPRGPWMRATARRLSGPDADAAEAIIQESFGSGRSLYERTLTHPDGVYFEVIPKEPRRR